MRCSWKWPDQGFLGLHKGEFRQKAAAGEMVMFHEYRSVSVKPDGHLEKMHSPVCTQAGVAMDTSRSSPCCFFPSPLFWEMVCGRDFCMWSSQKSSQDLNCSMLLESRGTPPPPLGAGQRDSTSLPPLAAPRESAGPYLAGPESKNRLAAEPGLEPKP